MNSLPGKTTQRKAFSALDWICGISAASLATVNLWKLESIREFLPVDLTLLSIAACLILLLVEMTRTGVSLKSSPALPIFFASLLPGVALSSLETPYATAKTVQLLLFVPFLIMVGGMLVNTRTRRQSFAFCIATIGLLVAIGIEFNGSQISEGSGRIALEDGNAIALGRMCALAGVALLIRTPLRWPGLWRVGAAALCFHAAALTGSRGPLVAAIGAIATTILFFTPARQGHGQLHKVMQRGFPILAAIYLAAPLIQGTRLTTAFGSDSDTLRLNLIKESWRIFIKHPWGIGWGDFALVEDIGLRIDSQGWAQYPHNVIAELLVEGGIAALIGALFLGYHAGKRLVQASKSWEVCPLTLFLTAFLSALTASDLTGNRALWVLCGIGLSCTKPFSDRPQP